MADYPMKSIFGKLLCLTRVTTAALPGAPAGITYQERLFARGGLIAPYLFLGTTVGSEAMVDIQGVTSVENLSTGTAAVASRGISNVTSGQSSLYTLGAPTGVGIVRKFFTTSTS